VEWRYNNTNCYAFMTEQDAQLLRFSLFTNVIAIGIYQRRYTAHIWYHYFKQLTRALSIIHKQVTSEIKKPLIKSLKIKTLYPSQPVNRLMLLLSTALKKIIRKGSTIPPDSIITMTLTIHQNI